jgi:hypothetical protein
LADLHGHHNISRKFFQELRVKSRAKALSKNQKSQPKT